MKFFFTLLSLAIMGACGQTERNKKLPILGNYEITQNDTLYHTIQPFSLWNQDSLKVNNETLQGKIYVADFFFTTCPTICPIMKTELHKVYEKYQNNDKVILVSHTIDPEFDTVNQLKEFANNLGVSSQKWHFLTGDKDSIYALAERSYLVMADEDKTAPGGYIHSGAFLLVDTFQRIRGVYDGTVSEQVELLMQDIDKLLDEK